MTSAAWYCIPYLPQFSARAKVSNTCWLLITHQPSLLVSQFWRVPLLLFTAWDVFFMSAINFSCLKLITCTNPDAGFVFDVRLRQGSLAMPWLFRMIRLQDAKDAKNHNERWVFSRESLWGKKLSNCQAASAKIGSVHSWTPSARSWPIFPARLWR